MCLERESGKILPTKWSFVEDQETRDFEMCRGGLAVRERRLANPDPDRVYPPACSIASGLVQSPNPREGIREPRGIARYGVTLANPPLQTGLNAMPTLLPCVHFGDGLAHRRAEEDPDRGPDDRVQRRWRPSRFHGFPPRHDGAAWRRSNVDFGGSQEPRPELPDLAITPSAIRRRFPDRHFHRIIEPDWPHLRPTGKPGPDAVRLTHDGHGRERNPARLGGPVGDQCPGLVYAGRGCCPD